MTTDELRTALERVKDLGGPVMYVGDYIIDIVMDGNFRFCYSPEGKNTTTPVSAKHSWHIIGVLMEDLQKRSLQPGLWSEIRELESDRWHADAQERGRERVKSIARNPLEAVIKTYIQALEATQSEP